MWGEVVSRLALLELHTSGSLRRRKRQEVVWAELAAMPWTARTSRRDELVLVGSRRADLEVLLERVWPGWREVLADLERLGLEPTPVGWAEYADRLRAERVPEVPAKVNRKTAASLVAPHSKATLTGRRRAALGEVDATHDGLVRMRPPAGLVAETPGGRLDLSAVAAILGEVALTERSFEGLSFEGEVRAILTVENLGAFVDLIAPPGWLVVFVAGWDSRTIGLLFERLAEVPALHFGDLDPAGVRIYRHLRALCPRLGWFVPDFASALVQSRGLAAEWPDDMDLGDTPELIRDLARRGLWLEQEPLAVDPRTPAQLEAWLLRERENPRLSEPAR